MQGFIFFLVIAILAFIGFAIYFFFKVLQFVIQAIDLYKDIKTRQDTQIKILKDIREITGKQDSGILKMSETHTNKSSKNKQISSNNASNQYEIKCAKCGALYDTDKKGSLCKCGMRLK